MNRKALAIIARIARFVPWFTLVFIAAALNFNWRFISGNGYIGGPGPWWWQTICDRAAVHAGQWWRVFAYMLPHASEEHLLGDLAYLLVVGTAAELILGSLVTAGTFIVCGVAGAMSFLLWATQYDYTVGSSCGTHGLLACLAIYLALRHRSVLLRLACAATIGYLIYTSVYAMLHGVMAWPFTMFPNDGYDHLGGIVAGMFLGVLWSVSAQSSREAKPDMPAQAATSPGAVGGV